jgi:hypothetical protein
MRKNEVGRDICAPYWKERIWRFKWDRWDRIDFERFFMSHLGLEVGHAAKWDSGQTTRGTRRRRWSKLDRWLSGREL